ncbi:H/ACA ribonucleoprotein complex non-core subunit NAF1-like [Hyalella azteca]|uniref:H/ACA ribonucleoprotein complex non-core subunit NAF1 n=1 Tax=Hyalella azteca TaxID=294128 RepID=A0A8B7NLY2_HYAAZ|nr:H/ACA ribonucleoprotein complex non-core subunit NAF1-like [Hyalella azteca]
MDLHEKIQSPSSSSVPEEEVFFAELIISDSGEAVVSSQTLVSSVKNSSLLQPNVPSSEKSKSCYIEEKFKHLESKGENLLSPIILKSSSAQKDDARGKISVTKTNSDSPITRSSITIKVLTHAEKDASPSNVSSAAMNKDAAETNSESNQTSLTEAHITMPGHNNPEINNSNETIAGVKEVEDHALLASKIEKEFKNNEISVQPSSMSEVNLDSPSVARIGMEPNGHLADDENLGSISDGKNSNEITHIEENRCCDQLTTDVEILDHEISSTLEYRVQPSLIDVSSDGGWTSDSEADSEEEKESCVENAASSSSEEEESSSEESSSEESSSSSKRDEPNARNAEREQIFVLMPKNGKKTKNKNEGSRLPLEIGLEDLPKIEYLQISVPEEEAQSIGVITSFVEQLVIVESYPNLRAIDLGSILFLKNGQEALGEIFDVMGCVDQPSYVVRFNSHQHILDRGIAVGDMVFSAPRTNHCTFVDVEGLMRHGGSDASWENDKEAPPCYVEYSDDEDERSSRKAKKSARRTDDTFMIKPEPYQKRSRPANNRSNTNNRGNNNNYFSRPTSSSFGWTSNDIAGPHKRGNQIASGYPFGNHQTFGNNRPCNRKYADFSVMNSQGNMSRPSPGDKDPWMFGNNSVSANTSLPPPPPFTGGPMLRQPYFPPHSGPPPFMPRPPPSLFNTSMSPPTSGVIRPYVAATPPPPPPPPGETLPSSHGEFRPPPPRETRPALTCLGEFRPPHPPSPHSRFNVTTPPPSNFFTDSSGFSFGGPPSTFSSMRSQPQMYTHETPPPISDQGNSARTFPFGGTNAPSVPVHGSNSAPVPPPNINPWAVPPPSLQQTFPPGAHGNFSSYPQSSDSRSFSARLPFDPTIKPPSS